MYDQLAMIFQIDILSYITFVNELYIKILSSLYRDTYCSVAIAADFERGDVRLLAIYYVYIF